MNKLSTKEKILTAARQLFVEHGFAGTSMGDIAKLAEVNHSLLFHHFGNKEKLWIAVKQDIAQDREQKSKILPDTNLNFKQFLKQLLQNSIKFYHANPDIIRMINRQRLEAKKSQEISITLSPEMQAWLDSFKHYQTTGGINPKLKPEYIATLILSIVSSAALDKNIFISKEKNLREYIDFCTEVLMGSGLKVGNLNCE